MGIKKIILGFVFTQIIISCGITTFYGGAPKKFNKEIEPIKIYWNAYSTEKEIETKLEAKLMQILENSDYEYYNILYQTNNNLGFSGRKYYIKLFSNINDKNNFEKSQESNKKLLKLLNSSNFKERWGQVSTHQIEWLFNFFPEFYTFNFTKKFSPNSDMVYIYSNLELTFDTRGVLISKLIRNTDFK